MNLIQQKKNNKLKVLYYFLNTLEVARTITSMDDEYTASFLFYSQILFMLIQKLRNKLP